ncbi:hypothetical protein BG004_005768 [Podila humilis]|nr:hypothetical protein BG004_005768 [Podila humilis]
MSLQVNFTTHGQELKAAYESILRPKDAKNGDNWAIFGYDKGTNDLKVLGTGSGGLEELEDEFVDGKIQYAFVRIVDPNSQLNKFILIAWCGDGVPESKKGLFNSHLADVSQFLKGYHLQINARSEFDVTPGQILKRVNEGSGSKYSVHKETYEQERIRPLQSAYKKTEIPDIAALQRNPTKPESAPKYNIGSKPFGASSTVSSTPPAKPAEPSWKTSSSSNFSSPPTSSSPSTSVKPVERSWKSGTASYVAPSSSSFNKVAPPSSLMNFGGGSSAPEPTVNKAQQMRLEREAREKEERTRIEKEIRDREARERQSEDQSGAQKQAEERRLQEQREREQEQVRSQDRVREERLAREREERERSEAEDAARSAREAAKAREEAQMRDRAAQSEEENRQKEQQQRQREKEEREETERLAKQKKADEDARRKQQEQEEQELERRRQLAMDEEEEEERRQQKATDEKRRQEKEEHERRLQDEVEAAAAKSVDRGADALLASSAQPISSGSVSAIVLYSYEKAEENEMSLFEGEIVVNVTELDVGWWSGESEDGTRSGLFPANYVEVIEHSQHAETAMTPVHYEEEHTHTQLAAPAAHHVEDAVSGKPTAVALYDYNAGEPNEISFSEGDVIVEIDFVTEDWWSGHSQDGTRSGLFPSNYVELHQ